jgi:hypothetical protein
MIVLTWQFLPKEVLCREPRLRCKGVKLAAALKVWQAKAPLNSQFSRPDNVRIQRLISRRSDQSYHEIGHF